MKKEELEFINRLYERSGGVQIFNSYETPKFDMYEIGEEIGFNHDLTRNIVRYLNQVGFLIYAKSAPFISITHKGIDEIRKSSH
jgi:predicted transcriptional regulator